MWRSIRRDRHHCASITPSRDQTWNYTLVASSASSNTIQPGVAKAMRVRLPIILGTLILLFEVGKTVPAWPQDRQPPPRGFDYWQPDWMVRELWGPGNMPKGMTVRLLRHTTYMQYGVPKGYEDAKSTVPPGPQTIAAGNKLYAQHCAVCHGRDGLGGGEPGRASPLCRHCLRT